MIQWWININGITILKVIGATYVLFFFSKRYMTVLRTHVIENWLWEEGREDFTSEQPGAKRYVWKKRKSQLRQEPSDTGVAAWGQQGLAMAYHICFGMSGCKDEFLKNTRGELMPIPGGFCAVADLLKFLSATPLPPTFIQRAFHPQLPAEYQTHMSVLQPAAWPLSCQLYKLFLFVMGKYHDTTNPASRRGWMAWLPRLTFPFREWRLPLTSSRACTCAFPFVLSM